jgi:hypothetical protein
MSLLSNGSLFPFELPILYLSGGEAKKGKYSHFFSNQQPAPGWLAVDLLGHLSVFTEEDRRSLDNHAVLAAIKPNS